MIDVDGLRFRYPGAPADTLKGLNFSVAEGEIFGFLGPSGAGKSTTQKILTGVAERYVGVARVLGAEVRAHSRDFYNRIGVSFETPCVYGRLTGLENLAFFAALHDGATEPPAALLGLVGLGGDGDQVVEKYSRGLKLRLNVCRALLNRPRLLFLDEPTSGQDPANARRIKDIILERRRTGTTVFITTHDMSVAAELCDRVGFIVDGRLVLVESPRSLMVERGRRAVRVEYTDGVGSGTRDFDLDGLADDAEFQRVLRSTRVERIHTLEATLEDIFIAVTGTALT
jgi:fluoroquinolone transport system ATP-binding protein